MSPLPPLVAELRRNLSVSGCLVQGPPEQPARGRLRKRGLRRSRAANDEGEPDSEIDPEAAALAADQEAEHFLLEVEETLWAGSDSLGEATDRVKRYGIGDTGLEHWLKGVERRADEYGFVLREDGCYSPVEQPEDVSSTQPEAPQVRAPVLPSCSTRSCRIRRRI